MKLSETQIKFYNDNGYLVLDDVHSQEYTERFLSAIRRHANKDFAAILNPDREDELIKNDERPKSDLTLEEIKETSNLCKEVISNKKIINVLRTLQNNDIVGLSSQMIFKEAYSTYSSQAWLPHQDNRYIDNQNAQYITANWFLRNADPENGGIYVYPGSHKLSLLPAPDKKSYRENSNTNPGRECQIPEEFVDKKKNIILKADSVVILNGNCIHGSYSNNSSRSRPWLSTCYITKGEYYNIGKNSKRIEIIFPQENEDE
jgi:phytanoyl-CoA hydroxylase